MHHRCENIFFTRLTEKVKCVILNVFICFVMKQTKSGPDHVGLKVSRPHEIWYTTGRTPLKERSAHRRENYRHNTMQTQETNIFALSGFRTHDPSNQVTADLRLRPHDHRDFFLIM
jgi:hypothetical protein